MKSAILVLMFESCLFFNLNTLTRLLNKKWEEAFEPLGLSPAHGYLLRLVLARPGATQKELAEKLELAPSTVTRFLETLESKGYVKKTCCNEDGRAMTVEATRKGRALEKDLEAASAQLSQVVSEALGEKHASELVKVLRADADLLSGRSKL